jgi:hypothetical protein
MPQTLGVTTDSLVIVDAQNHPVMRIVPPGVIQFLNATGGVQVELASAQVADLPSRAQLQAQINQLQAQIGSLMNMYGALSGTLAALDNRVTANESFIRGNFDDSGSRLTLKKRTIPLEGFQQRDGDGIPFFDDNSNGRCVIRNYGADSTILSRNDGGTGWLRVNKRQDTEE